MGIPPRSYFIIRNPDNDIRCRCAGHDPKSKLFVGEIWLYHDDWPHECLITTIPIFLSAKHAESGMESLVEIIRRTKPTEEKQQS
jgi:hypothetical protein